MRDIRYLVFSGGGAAGYAYAGALEQLGHESLFSFDNIKAVAGTSVGAIAALIVSLNFSPTEASEKLKGLDLKKFADGGNYVSQMYRLLSTYGIYKGHSVSDFINELIKAKTHRSDPENVTFADLKNLGCKDLYVIATKLYKSNNIPTGKQKVFSFEKTPHTSVTAAIRASAAAPVFFQRVRLKKIEKGKYILDETGDLYDDGGLLNNFAINIFDDKKYFSPSNSQSLVNPHTLGLSLRETERIFDKDHPQTKTPIDDYQPFVFAESIVNSIIHQTDIEKFDRLENRERTIQIDRKGVKLQDFKIDEKTKLALFESGKEAVRKYFTVTSAPISTLWQSLSKQDRIFAEAPKLVANYLRK